MIPALLYAFSALQMVLANPIPEGEHCVAYRVYEVKFLVSKSEVVGKNCSVAAQVLPEVGGSYHIEITVPIDGFQSGNSERDKAVEKILKIDKRPSLLFVSTSRTPGEWRELFAKGQFDLTGTIQVGDQIKPLSIPVTYSNTEGHAEVSGEAKLKFEDFDLKPPKVVGGLIAKVKPELELVFRLKSDRILGADSIELVETK